MRPFNRDSGSDTVEVDDGILMICLLGSDKGLSIQACLQVKGLTLVSGNSLSAVNGIQSGTAAPLTVCSSI